MPHAQAIRPDPSAESGAGADLRFRRRTEDAEDATIVHVQETLEGLRALLPDEALDGSDIAETRFRIRLASNAGQRSTASYLIQKMYGWRGYSASAPGAAAPGITLVASDAERALATISVGFDSPQGLVVEQLYPDEIGQLRRGGASLCEFTKLAVDGADRSREVLAMIFHIAYMYSRRLNRCTDLVIEVNPRHVRFYERMLGFAPLGPERLCPRVGAPAVLMRLRLEHAQEQIERFGGRREGAVPTRTLYPHFFSVEEENGIVARLLTLG